MLEALILGVIGNVLSDYISGLLTENQRVRRRSELVALIEANIAVIQLPADRADAAHVAERELDAVVRRDRDLSWQEDRLVVRPPGETMGALPSSRAALDELVQSVAARRRELGLALTAEKEPVEGVVIPPGEPVPTAPSLDLRAEVLGLQTEVLREKDRRRRESGLG